jgi:pilus assembly protein CpaC
MHLQFPQLALLVGAVLLAEPQHAFAQAAPSASNEEMNLAVGENKTLPATEVRNYLVGDPNVIDVRVSPNGKLFIVVGKKQGTSTLLLINKDGSESNWHVNVFIRRVEGVEDELHQLLSGNMGVRVRRVGARLFIEGGVSSEAELERIQHIAALYAGQVESLVVLGGAAAENKINVRVDVYFVQYEKTKLMRLGIHWPGSIGPATLSGGLGYDFVSKVLTGSISSAINAQPLPSLDIAAHRGYAKVLKHATVMAANGAQAVFSNGGAQNYQVTTGLAASIQRISYGTQVKVLPRFEPTSREIQMQVDLDVSDLTPPLASAVLPGQTNSTLNTQVTLKLGESLVLSGIRTQAVRNSSNGLPWLHEIPIIGALFGSRNDESNEVEGAIFVVPGVVESAPQQASELIARALDEYDRFSGDMQSVRPNELMPGSPARPRVTP